MAEGKAPDRHYLGDELLEKSVERIGGSSGPLTAIVGAGVSMEATLPSWDALVRRLVERVAHRRLPAPDRDEWVDHVIEPGLTAAGAVVQTLVPRTDIRGLLVQSLYGERPASSYHAGALAQEIARMKLDLGAQMKLATLNYDMLLEEALERASGEKPSSFIDGRREQARKPAVYHLHGRLAPRLRTGRIVLSDADYVVSQAAKTWPESFVAEALQSSTCLFLGVSLRDPNLIRWLHLYREPNQSHLAVFVRQALPRLRPSVRRALEEATRARWQAYGVEVVWADYFGELAQVIHEMTLRRCGRDVEPYEVRARRRLRAGRRTVVPGQRRFAAAQRAVSDILNELLAATQAILADAGADLQGEKFGLGLWALDRTAGRLEHWASADRYLRQPSDVRQVPLSYDSKWVAVQATTLGASVQLDPDSYASRWGVIRGIPIIYDADAPGRSLVGSLTLTASSPRASSPLTHAPAGILRQIDDLLASVSARLFSE